MASEIVQEAMHEMDKIAASVLPSHDHTHARIAVREEEDLSDEQREFAVELSRRLLEKGKTNSAEKAAAASIKHARKKL